MAQRALWGIVFVLQEVNGVLDGRYPMVMVDDYAMLSPRHAPCPMATPKNFNLLCDCTECNRQYANRVCVSSVSNSVCVNLKIDWNGPVELD